MKRFYQVIFLLLCFAGQSMAQTTCTSIKNGDWSSSGSWDCNNNPPGGSDVKIANGHKIKVKSNTNAVANVTIDSGGTLEGKDKKILNLTGDFTNSGNFSANKGTVALTGTTQKIVGSVTFYKLTVSSTTIVIGAGSAVTVSNKATIPTATTIQILVGSSLKVGGVTYACTYNGTYANLVTNGCSGGGGGNVTCTVNTGLINAPDATIDLNAAAGVRGLVIGVGQTNCNTCQDTPVAFVNGVSTPLPNGTNQLNAVSVASTSYAVAVGNNGTLVQFDGTAWSSMSTNGSQPSNDVNGVKTYGTNLTYAVGDDGIYFFNGTTWHRQLQLSSVPNVNGQGADKFEAIWGNSATVYALADNGALYSKSSTASVTTWTKNADVPTALDNANFNGITGDAAGNVYITGQTDNNNGYIYKFVPSPSPGTWTNLLTTTTSFDLNSVAVNPLSGAITAVGDNGAQLVSGGNGAGPWTPTAPVNSANDINGVYISPTGTTYLAGQTPPGCSPPLETPIADFRFDEASWNGTASEVVDSSLSAMHGSAKRGATPAPGKICNAASLAANYLEVPDDPLLDITGALTVTAWLKPARWGNPATDIRMTFISKDTNFEAHILDSGKVNWWWDRDSMTSTATVPIGVWTHVALVYQPGLQTIYIDGVASGTNGAGSVLTINTLPLQIGADQGIDGRLFDGMIDEVKIFHASLSAARIADGYANERAGKNWDGSTRVCPSAGLHHLEIQHSGSGLTCAASTLTVRACADAACTVPFIGGVSGTLTATGTPTVNWDGTTGGATGAGFVIAAGSSSVTKNMQVATAGNVVIGLTGPLPVPTNTTTCNFGTPSCTFTADLAGLIFAGTTTSTSLTMPAQVAGIATSPNLLYLRALQATSNSPAICTPAIIGQTTPVNMGYTCNNPGTCQLGNLLTVNSTSVAGSPNLNPLQNSTSVSLNFDANGSAPLSVRYDDVGQITLHASKQVTPAGGTPVTLNGSSNPYVVAPHHFGFSAVTPGPIKAGNNFAVTVTAYNGLPAPTATANFGKESVTESVTLTHTKYQPAGSAASNGIFSGTVGAFNSGAATAGNLNWSEVGTIDLTATLVSGNYLVSGLTATGNTGAAGAVGPFIPDHFVTTVADGCTGCGFTYSGQPFDVTVTAMNGLATPTKTFNYDGSASTSPNFAKAVTLTAWDAATGLTQNPNGLLLSAAKTAVPVSAFKEGEAKLDTEATQPLFTFATVNTAPTRIKLRAEETTATPAVSSLGFAEGSTEIRSGRIKLPNVYGSERLSLPITATVQYYNGTNWVTSASDNVTLLDSNLTSAGGNLIADNSKNTGSANCAVVTAPAAAAVSAGVRTLSLSRAAVAAPVPKCTTLFRLDAPSYLLNPSPQGSATFGIFKSPLIYRRENY